MTVSLRGRLSKEPAGDHEAVWCWKILPTPWIAPEAYLHWIFKPAPPVVLARVAERLRFPEPFRDFLSVQNGAHLFALSVSIYGVVPEGLLLDRNSPDSLPPFNIESEISSWGEDPDPVRLLMIGSYSWDGSRIFMERANGRIRVIPRHSDLTIAEWADLDSWLLEELGRLGELCRKAGGQMRVSPETLPEIKGVPRPFEGPRGRTVRPPTRKPRSH